MSNINSVLDTYKKPLYFWITTILLQIIFLATLITSIHPFLSSSNGSNKKIVLIWISFAFLGLSFLFSFLHLYYSKKSWKIFDTFSTKHREYEAKLDELRLETKKTLFAFIPIVGLFSSLYIIKCFSIRDAILKKEKVDVDDFVKCAQTNIRFWQTLQIISCVSLFAFCAIYSQSTKDASFIYISEWIGSIVFLIYATSIAFNKYLIYRCNMIIRRLGEIDEVQEEKIKLWKTCMKWSYTVYIPIIGMLSLIPFFICKSIYRELKVSNSYIYSCQYLLTILLMAISCLIPYVIYCGVGFSKENLISLKETDAWVIIPPLLWIISFTSISFYLSLKNTVHAEILSEKKKKYSILDDINTLSKLSSFLWWIPIFGWIPIAFMAYSFFKLKKSVPQLDI
ncbi:hypothetical protein [Candidatus Mycoplasma haematohominis]|uniref:hypothetical protein n=1 Tax=Candidatus Mycoplasma haematohominis TaxID=1494318 RepID=UPI001C0A73D3|nr:hypothetical protein [Candidatus Mycoplasma haemohominis]